MTGEGNGATFETMVGECRRIESVEKKNRAWFWVCESDRLPGLWEKWLERGVASIGWKPEEENRSFTAAKNRIGEMHKGDMIVSYLKDGRIGGIGEFTGETQLEYERASSLFPETGEHARFAYVKWADGPAHRYLSVPDGASTPKRCTILSIDKDGFELIEQAFNSQEMWCPFPESEHLVKDEKKDLHPLVLTNLQKLRLTLYRPDKEFEYPAPPTGRIDILAKDADGIPVVIEMKTHEVGDAVVGQVLRYMSWVKHNLKPKPERVRGMIIAGIFTPFTGYATRDLPDISLYRYEAEDKKDITFIEVKKPRS
jgi:RecB family endonuclease NucS